MKIILNNQTDQVIKVDHINKDYNFNTNENVLFVLDCTLDSLEYKSSLNYLDNYFYIPITSYTIINEVDDSVEEMTNINAKLKNYSQNFSDGYFFARFVIFVLQENKSEYVSSLLNELEEQNSEPEEIKEEEEQI